MRERRMMKFHSRVHPVTSSSGLGSPAFHKGSFSPARF
jgi:hypothetical protein